MTTENTRYDWVTQLNDQDGQGLIALYNDSLSSGTYIGYTEIISAQQSMSIIKGLNEKLDVNAIHLLLIKQGDSIVGSVQVTPSSMPNCRHSAELSKGIIASHCQGSGLMRQSFLQIALYCQEMGYEQVTLDVRYDSKPHLIWQKLGFKEFGVLTDYARVDGKKLRGAYMYQPTHELIERLNTASNSSVALFDSNAPMYSEEDFKVKLREELESRITLTHPIIKRVMNGEPQWELLRYIALQGYQLTKHFLEYIETLYFHCPRSIHKLRLLNNMYEEETGFFSRTKNHVVLMENFIKAIGISDEDRDAAVALPATQELIDYRMDLVKNRMTFHMGAAAVTIGSEGQNLETAAGEARHDMLPKLYNLTEKDLWFFSVHQQEDVAHVREGIEMVACFCETPLMQQQALEAVRKTCDLFFKMYDNIESAYDAQHPQ